MLPTKAQEKMLCKTCPLAKTANLIGDSWVLLIVRDLLAKPKRFCDLEASLAGISTRTLTNKLKMLEETGIIKKTAAKTAPRISHYTLTKKGLGLHDIAEAMRKYGKKYLS